MVRNYTQDSCTYRLGSLKNVLYLLPKSSTSISYQIDNHDAKVTGITASRIIKFETVSTKFNLTETLNGRLDFDSTVTALLRENFASTWIPFVNSIRYEDFYVVVEDNEGSQFIQSPEFTSELSYKFTFNSASSSNNAEISFKVTSNNPFLLLDSNISATETVSEPCLFDEGIVSSMWLSPFRYAFTNASDGEFTDITCIGGEMMHKIEFNEGSFSFEQSYDGNEFIERLQFDIPLSAYRHYWAYNLLEFRQNKYVLMFSTSIGNYYAAGFDFGFQPSFTIETSETETELNKITFTLSHNGQSSILFSDIEPEIHESQTGTYAPVTEVIKDTVTGEVLPNHFCISKNESVYTLVQMLTETNIPTDSYMCLEGYETVYQNLNITGTYTTETEFGFPLVFQSSDCSYKDNCELTYFPRTVYTFQHANESITTPVKGPCPWYIDTLPDWITADITEGQGGISYNVTFTCELEGSPMPITDVGYIHSFDNVGIIHFVCQKEPDWFKPYDIQITAQKQTVNVNVFEQQSKYEVCEIPQGVTVRKIPGTKKLEISVPENTDPNNGKTYRIKLCSPYHEDDYILIHQDVIYYEWKEVVGEIMCEDGTSYKKLRLYKGYTYNDINIYAGEQRTGSRLIVDDERCNTSGGTDEDNYFYEWIDGFEFCNGKDLWEAKRKRESFDSKATWNWTDEYELVSLIQETAEQCDETSTEPVEKWEIDESKFICDGTTSYFLEYKWLSYDNINYVKKIPEESRTSDRVRREHDYQCGEPIDDPEINIRWVIATGYVCVDGDKYSRLRMQRSDDGGLTFYDTDIYRANNLIEEQSEDCEGLVPDYVWIPWLNTTICQGFNEYYVQRYVYTYDYEDYYLIEPASYMPVSIAKENSTKCGYVDDSVFRWNTATLETICSDGDLYRREDYEVSLDNGTTWIYAGESRLGELIQRGSTECYEITEISEFRVGTDYVCSGCHSYYILHKWVSQDEGAHWLKSDWSQRSDILRLSLDPECGCSQPSEPQRRLVEVLNEWICIDEAD